MSHRHLALVLLASTVACRHPSNEQVTASAKPTAAPVDDPAVEVGAIVKRDVRIALSCESADWTWATCHDESTAGFDAVKGCVDTAAKSCRDAVGKFVAPSAKDKCGKDVESVTRRYVEARAKHLEGYSAWLETKRKILTPALKDKTIRDVCSAHESWCAGLPAEPEGADFSTVNAIECVKPLFECGPPAGVECRIPTMACRLGIGLEKCESGSVKSQKTGALIY